MANTWCLCPTEASLSPVADITNGCFFQWTWTQPQNLQHSSPRRHGQPVGVSKWSDTLVNYGKIKKKKLSPISGTELLKFLDFLNDKHVFCYSWWASLLLPEFLIEMTHSRLLGSFQGGSGHIRKTKNVVRGLALSALPCNLQGEEGRQTLSSIT